MIEHPDTIRGYMRERAHMALAFLSGRVAGPQPWVVTRRKNVSLSTHWTLPARRSRALLRARRRAA
jgi:hypothetical protein